MKRSEINQALKAMEALIKTQGMSLPPFCSYSSSQWEEFGEEYDEIRRAGLGWDITDYGHGDFERVGFSLITLRNGSSLTDKTYAEKLLMLKEGQMAPMHFHWHKMEDIINRGGGDLLIRLYQADQNEDFSKEDVIVSLDGVRHCLKAGTTICLRPGQSVSLTPYLYHDFHVKTGSGDVLIGEVSMVNDDKTDNRFYEAIGRFPEIEEDEAPYRLLCTEYPE